jgi:uncharacterized protein (DUF302 family)
LLIGNKSFSTLLALGIMRSVSAKLRQAVKREEHERQGDKVKWRALLSALLAMSLTLLAAGGALAQATNAHGGAAAIPQESPLPSPTVQPFTPNTMMDPVTPEARRKFMRNAVARSSLSLRERINLVAYKVEAQPGLSWDDVISSMKQRANKINLKFIGVQQVHKEIEAITGKPTPRVEIYHFCDALLARELLDYSLEFAVLLPCRIAVVEDARQRIWLSMLDWDVSWTDAAPNPERLPDSLYQAAARLRNDLEAILQAGANGAL